MQWLTYDISNGAMQYTPHSSTADIQLLQIVVEMQRLQKKPDYFAVCTCLVHLNDTESAANDLFQLTKMGGDVFPYLTLLTPELFNSTSNRI